MKLSIGKKISLGFGIMILLTVTVIGEGYYQISNLTTLFDASAAESKHSLFLTNKIIDHLNWVGKVQLGVLGNREIDVETNPHKCGLGKWLYKSLGNQTLDAEEKKILRDIEPIHAELHRSVAKIKEHHNIFDPDLQVSLLALEVGHLNWFREIRNMFSTGKRFRGQVDPTKCRFAKWYSTFKTDDVKLKSMLNAFKKPHAALHLSGKEVLSLWDQNKKGQAASIFQTKTSVELKKVRIHFKKVSDYIKKKVVSSYKAKKIFDEETIPVFHKVIDRLETLRKKVDRALGKMNQEVLHSEESSKRIFLVFGSVVILLGIIFSYFLSASITTVIKKIGASLRDSSDHLLSASGELSSASSQLANSSTEQASSVEETSASVEEIAGMVGTNVQKAQECAEQAKVVSSSSKAGNRSIMQLLDSMKEISKSNDKIQELVRIIEEIGDKTSVIDEIVFQTKLLSFNASVEAERAGENGRGFAVVAQEVGSLAQMSGKAAADISLIVKNSIVSAESITKENKNKVDAGEEVAASAASILGEITTSSDAVAQNIAEILSSSQESSTGINQINIAIGTLDEVTQNNAAASEEVASSSEVLNEQARVLDDIIVELGNLVGGLNHGHD